VTGNKGVGKTRFVKTLVNYIQFRHKFPDGIFMVDADGAKTIE
jgi:hypothetical protein